MPGRLCSACGVGYMLSAKVRRMPGAIVVIGFLTRKKQVLRCGHCRAARIEELTKTVGSEVLVSETTAALLPDGMPMTEAGEFTVRGSSKALRLYAPGLPEKTQ